MTTQKPLVQADAPEVQSFVNANSLPFRMKQILARLPNAEELGKQHVTYVPDPDGNIIVEGTNVHAAGKIIVRFPISIGELDGEPVYNEWLVGGADFVKKYGGDIPSGTDWEAFQKSGIEQFAVIDETLMTIFGAPSGETKVKVGVSWAADGTMWAIRGGFATGYHVIAPVMGEIMYEPVEGWLPKGNQKSVMNPCWFYNGLWHFTGLAICKVSRCFSSILVTKVLCISLDIKMT